MQGHPEESHVWPVKRLILTPPPPPCGPLPCRTHPGPPTAALGCPAEAAPRAEGPAAASPCLWPRGAASPGRSRARSGEAQDASTEPPPPRRRHLVKPTGATATTNRPRAWQSGGRRLGEQQQRARPRPRARHQAPPTGLAPLNLKVEAPEKVGICVQCKKVDSGHLGGTDG